MLNYDCLLGTEQIRSGRKNGRNREI